MESTVFIEHLKNSHQSALGEIDNSELKINFLRLIYSQGLTNFNPKNPINKTRLAEKSTEKINSLLPKCFYSYKLNLFESILNNFKNTSLALNVPATLIKVKDCPSPYLIKTNSSGKIHIKESCEQEFFRHKFAAENLFCYKNSIKGTISLHGSEDSKSFNTDYDIIQEFIHCKSNQISITRALWIQGKAIKYYNIIKRNKTHNYQKLSPKINSKNIKYQRRNSSFNELSTFKYTDLLQKSSQSINNPFKISEKRKSLIFDSALKDSKISFNKAKLVNKSYSLGALKDEPENYEKLILNTEKSDDCFSFESKIKIPEIEEMVIRFVNFLNHCVFTKKEVSGIVLDFIQGKESKWYLLDCKECSTVKKNNIILDKNPKCSHLRVKSSPDLNLSLMDDRAPTNCNYRQIGDNYPIKGLEIRKFKEPTKIVKASTTTEAPKSSEKELFKRLTLLSNKIDKITEKNHLPSLSNNDVKEQSIHAYNDFILHKNWIIDTKCHKNDTNSCLVKEEKPKKNCPFLQSHDNQDLLKHKNKPLWNDESHAYAKKCYSDIAEIYDEMKINSKNISLSKNFISKYGGDNFWDKFVISLYRKFISDKKLNEYFKNSCQKMIYTGFHQIFSGNSNIEFRRSIRNAHQSIGVAEEDFYLFLDKFEETFSEFSIEEDDKACIMSQIRSMMCLVCKLH
ncbi:unnamed protein product [Blepharisma stoltei]|uniref:Globin n=1 Tax=Blepharisma stoltei TaxID=1481888 RepID=A0AAU9K432_9CILI|nr:unnamed protein product [Blepharisma stoltei]